MSKKSSGLFTGTKGASLSVAEFSRGTDYNSAGSKDVKMVNAINIIDKACHPKIPTKGKPNSVTKLIRNGQVDQERYYDESGDVYLDIDYSDHGNSANHPIVPHEHIWIKDNCGKPQRKRYERINKEGDR